MDLNERAADPARIGAFVAALDVKFRHAALVSIVTVCPRAVNERASKITFCVTAGGGAPPSPPLRVAQWPGSDQFPVPPTQYRLTEIGVVVTAPRQAVDTAPSGRASLPEDSAMPDSDTPSTPSGTAVWLLDDATAMPTPAVASIPAHPSAQSGFDAAKRSPFVWRSHRVPVPGVKLALTTAPLSRIHE